MMRNELQWTSKQYAHSNSPSPPMDMIPRFDCFKNLLARNQPTVAIITPVARKSTSTMYSIKRSTPNIPEAYAKPHANAETVINEDRRITNDGSSRAHVFLVCL